MVWSVRICERDLELKVELVGHTKGGAQQMMWCTPRQVVILVCIKSPALITHCIFNPFMSSVSPTLHYALVLPLVQ